MSEHTPDIDKLRARIIWLSAKLKFDRGYQKASFSRPTLEKLLDVPLGVEIQSLTGQDELLRAVALLPDAAHAKWDGAHLKLLAADSRKVSDEDVQAVLEYWRVRTGRTARTLATPSRLQIIRARLKDGYTTRQLCNAINQMACSEFHLSQGFTDLSHALRLDRLERWLAAAAHADQSSDVQEFDAVASEMIQRRKNKRRKAGGADAE